jgi:aquaporin related protein
MAQDQTGALPVYYGERLNDGTVIESSRTRPMAKDSRDALLRLPIQPHEAHVHPVVSPVSPAVPPDSFGLNLGTPARPHGSTVGDSSRWVTYPLGEQDDYQHRSRRNDRYAPSEYRESVSRRRAPYVEEYSDGEDYPRATRRTNRRHTRPPPAHGRVPGRVSHEQARPSFDSRRDFDYDDDIPRKARFRYSEDDYEEDERRSRTAYAGGGGRRGPPRNPPSTEEVMRLPWTMWMNSNAKNRRSLRPKPKPRRQTLTPPTSDPLHNMYLDDDKDHSMLPARLSHRILIIS